MINHHQAGGTPSLIAFHEREPTLSAELNNGPLGMSAVIGVSVRPGLMVVMWMFGFLARRCRRPSSSVSRPALAEPYTKLNKGVS